MARKTTEELNDPLLKPDELAAILGVAVRTLEGWRAAGKGPRFVRLSGLNGVRYRLSELNRWMDERDHATELQTRTVSS